MKADCVKIGMLTQWFDPETGGGAVSGVLARGLAVQGHELSVLTGFPNYPTGQIYPGYKQSLRHVELVSPSIRVRRVPLFPSHSGRAAARATSYLSFASSAAALGVRFLSDSDAAWVYNSPGTVGMVAERLTHRHDVPFLLHVMDLWPDSVIDSGMIGAGRARRAAHRTLSGMVNRTYSAASLIAVTSPGQLDVLVERGVKREKLRYVPVWADETIYSPRPADRTLLPEAARDSPLVVMYAGALGHVQGLDHVVRAAEKAEASGMQLVFVGSGIAEESLQALARQLQAGNVHFLGPRPAAQMGDLVSAADLHLVSLADTPLLRVTMPSKVQSILATGRPIIGCCSGDAAKVIVASGAGVTLAQGDVDELAGTFSALATDARIELEVWGKAGRAYYEQEFGSDIAVARVELLLAGLS